MTKKFELNKTYATSVTENGLKIIWSFKPLKFCKDNYIGAECRYIIIKIETNVVLENRVRYLYTKVTKSSAVQRTLDLNIIFKADMENIEF